MKFSEKIKLWHRAWKYKYRDDIGEIAYLQKSIHNGDTAFDIGSHKGGYLYWMQKAVGKNGKVIAFEPQLNGSHYLSDLKSGMNWDNVSVENKALSDRDGEEILYIDQQPFSVSFEASLEMKYSNTAVPQKVMITSVDNYCSLHKLSPSFLKIDVEGHEWSVLNGAKNTMQQLHPKILLECEARHGGVEKARQCFDLILSSGYKGFFIHRKEIKPLGEFDFSIHQSQKGENFWNSPDYCNNFVFES